LQSEARETFGGEFPGTVLALPSRTAGGHGNDECSGCRCYSMAPIINAVPLPYKKSTKRTTSCRL
jgi:hypothetical protein